MWVNPLLADLVTFTEEVLNWQTFVQWKQYDLIDLQETIENQCSFRDLSNIYDIIFLENS